jgi:protein-tyrosine-phosphatase
MALYAAGIMLSSRTQLLFCLITTLPGLCAQTRESKHPEVVFVCEHGAAKSIIAAAEFNKLAEQRGLPHRASARGINPDPAFSSTVVRGLQKDGLPDPKGKPQTVTADDIAQAERIVTLGCKLPQRGRPAKRLTDWNDITSPSKDYNAAREDITHHVRKLVEDLARERNARK